MKNFVTALAERMGYAVVPLWRQPGLPLATLTRDVLNKHGVDLVLDIGANVGQYRDFLRTEAGYDGKIISFEPQPELAEVLDKRARTDAKWEVRHHALGSSDSELFLNVMQRGQFSSFLEPDHSKQPQFAELNRVKRTVAVPVKRLDQIELPAGSRGIFLKIDTQGFDLEVIRGAMGVQDKVRAIQTEISIQAIYKGMPRYSEVLSELEGLGFLPAGFFAVSSSPELAAIEFDCLLVKRGSAAAG